MHRRFEVVAGAQAEGDWVEEGGLLAQAGIPKVYSFHMALLYSRQPFTCFTTSMDAATWWECHRKAFDHFGGVPGSCIYDWVKTIVRRHVAPGLAVPLHPTAAAFAAHYGFTVDVLAANRPTGKGQVERQAIIVRDHVLSGRSYDSIAALDAAFADWHAIRLGQVHRTHGEVIAVRDRAALGALPAAPSLVPDSHLRRVGKDCLLSFEASLYSLPARRIGPGRPSRCASRSRQSPSTPSTGPSWPATRVLPSREAGSSTMTTRRAACRSHPVDRRRAASPRRPRQVRLDRRAGPAGRCDHPSAGR